LIYTAQLPIKLPGLNEYTAKNRANRHVGAKLKKDTESSIIPHLQNLPNFTKPVKINFIWCEENKRRDLDNVAFAKKFILDALVKSGKLINDNQKYVRGFQDTFEYDTAFKGVVLQIEEES